MCSRTVSPTNIPIKLNLTDELKKVSLTDNGNKDVRVAGGSIFCFNLLV